MISIRIYFDLKKGVGTSLFCDLPQIPRKGDFIDMTHFPDEICDHEELLVDTVVFRPNKKTVDIHCKPSS